VPEPLTSTAEEPEEPEELDESSSPADEFVAQGRSRKGLLWLSLLVPVATCGFAGSKEPWALGMTASLVALHLLLVRPTMRVPRSIAWPLALAALLMLGAFLPLKMSAWPEWRSHFAEDYGITTPELRTPQPWVTLESWTLVMVGLAWLWTCMGRGFNEAERRWMVRMLTILVAVLSLLAIFVAAKGIQVPFWRADWNAPFFGPFPNRNNFSGFVAMGAVLAFASAYDAWRRRSAFWLMSAVCVGCIIWALVSNTSRAGVVLFFVGVVGWMFFASFSRRSAHRMGVSAAVVILFLSVFLLFGRSILQRMHSEGGLVETLSSDNRVHIMQDTVRLISQSAWLGVGLGNFEPTFAFVTSFSDHVSRPIHPESDWLWLGSECGLPVLFLFWGAFLAWFLHTGPWKRASNEARAGQRDRRLRNACGIAVLMIAAHGFADVPGHSVGVPFTMILIGAMALRPRRLVILKPSPVRNNLFRFGAAAFCLGAAWMWFSISWGRPLLPGSSVARQLSRQGDALAGRGDLAGAHEDFSRALAMKPLQWNYYYQRAVVELPLGMHEQALEDFNRERYLEPHDALICAYEASFWLPYQPAYSIPALREAMKRHKERSIEFYSSFLSPAQNYPELRPQLFDLATDAKLKLAYLGIATKDEFGRCLQALLDQDPRLDTLTSEERLTLFKLWYERGDRARLFQMMDADAVWRRDGWSVVAADRASKGDFQGAYQLALDSVRPPTDRMVGHGNDLGQLRREFMLHPTDATYGLELYEMEKSKGLLDDALTTLAKISQLPEAPKRLPYEESVILARKGEYAKAWEKMNQYIQSIR